MRAPFCGLARTLVGRSSPNTSPTPFDDPDHDGAPQRFLNEWAGLVFLTEIGAGRVAPTVIGDSAESGSLVLEEDRGVFSELASVLHDCTDHWRSSWPEIGTIATYPALRNGA